MTSQGAHAPGLENAEEPEETSGDPWWRIFSAGQRELQLWACVRAWRFVALRKKRRFLRLAGREQLEIDFFERALPLHAAVAFSDTEATKWRFEWVQLMAELIPEALESTDSWLRIPLYYAIYNRWIIHDQLSWFVARSQRVLLRKDTEGRTLMAHAIAFHCPEEIVMMMAVEYAQSTLASLETFVQNRQIESGRRLCVQMVNGYFAGVPHFPLASCLRLLCQNDALAIVDGMQRTWREFTDKWGYYGVPLIMEDLPLVRRAPLDSVLQISIQARGEPLSYQWHLDDEPIAGATQSSLLVSHCLQPHNEGVYHCDVVNWKGRASSFKMKLVVVDDRHGPDPSLRFLFTAEDKQRVLGRGGADIHRIAASRGALLVASLPLSHPKMMPGCSLLLPPECFQSFDKSGNDVSDTIGMDIAMRVCVPSDGVYPKLTRSEKLLSPVVEVHPFSVPALLQPAILSIPHSWVNGRDEFHELVVVELPVDGATSHKTAYKEVSSSRIISSSLNGSVSFEISRFGRFAVVARSVVSANRESEAPLEGVVLCVSHPRHLLSSTLRTTPNARKSLAMSVWLALNRPDTIDTLHHEIKRTEKRRDVMTSSMTIQIRQNQLLHLRVGSKTAFTHVWRGDRDELLSHSPSSSTGVFNVCTDSVIGLSDLGIDTHASSHHNEVGSSSSIDIFRVIEMVVAVKKPLLYPVTSKRKDAQASGLLLMEQRWSIPIPVKHDMLRTPPKPILHQRLDNQIAIAYLTEPTSETLVSRNSQALQPPTRLFEDIHEMEREFTPYFYAVEFARFSATFWQRYDKTWWFDKTKSTVLEGMFKLAHAGVDPFAVISSNAFAGTVRVVQCSIDAVGVYSEPLLFEPRDSSTDNEPTPSGTVGVGDDLDEASLVPRGLRGVTLPATCNLSPQTHASIERLRGLLDTAYNFPELPELIGECGVGIESIRALLESRRAHLRAINCDVALLIFVMERVTQFVKAKIFVRSNMYGSLWKKLVLLHRLLAEIDCFPLEYGSALTDLYTIMRDFFVIVHKRASNGWLSRYLLHCLALQCITEANALLFSLLLDDWDETSCDELVTRTIRLLRNEAAPLQGSADLLLLFEHNEGDTCSVATERFAVQQLREFILLTINRPQAHDYRELAALIRRFLPCTIAAELTIEDWEDLVHAELQSDSLKRALDRIREADTLANHIRSISPADQDYVPSTVMPQSIIVQFGLHVVHVDTQHAIKVTNSSLRCSVQGVTSFAKEQKRLVFTPSIPFDRHTLYQVKLRAQYVHTALSGALPASATVGFEFTTT